MDVKLVLLMNCVALVCCQNTISNRDDAEWQNEFFEDVKSQLESIRQLLMTRQKTDVSNDRQAIQKMKSEIIQEIRQQFLEIDIKSEMASIRQLLINLQQKKSETEEIRQAVIQQQNRPRKECPFGFDYLPEAGSCFILIVERMTWDNATETCRGIMPGVHLAAITSQEVNYAITRYVQSQFSKNNIGPAELLVDDGLAYAVWTSGQRRNPGQCNDTFVWRTLKGLEIPINYTNWNTGEPNCQRGESCVHIATSNGHVWNDNRCNYFNLPLCQI